MALLSALAAGAWCGAAPGAQPATAWPAVPGAAFALRSTAVAAPVIAFDARGRKLLAFNCEPRGRALIGRFHDLVCDGGSFHARDAGPWIGLQVATSGVFTLELTLTPAASPPQAPGVVLAFGDDAGEDVAVVHDAGGLSLRVGGRPAGLLFTPEAGRAEHVLVACAKERWVAYRGGQAVRSGALPAGAAAWQPRQLVAGAAWSGAEPWRGRMEGIAVFPRALTDAEAAAEAAAFKALQAGRKPAAAVRFRGSLVRQAQTAELAAIRPYTRSLTAAVYKVEQVLAGDYQQPTITVLHWMIMDGKRLPIADRAPGAVVELAVESLDDHPQLESCRRDDLADGDPAAELFYCEREEGL